MSAPGRSWGKTAKLVAAAVVLAAYALGVLGALFAYMQDPGVFGGLMPGARGVLLDALIVLTGPALFILIALFVLVWGFTVWNVFLKHAFRRARP